MAELRKLWAFAEQHEIALRTVSYVRSEDNPADAPSRLAGGDSWMVRREVFSSLDRRFGPHSVDRFASASAHVLDRFNSLFEDPSSWGHPRPAAILGMVGKGRHPNAGVVLLVTTPGGGGVISPGNSPAFPRSHLGHGP